jgi:hypothetical protein
MRLPQLLGVLSVAGLMVGGGVVAAHAASEPAASVADQETVEVFSEDGTIVRAPVRAGNAFQRRVEGADAVGLSAPLTAAERVQATAADGTVTTLVSNGPAARRFDLVFVGDGYQAGEQGLFHEHAAGLWEALKQREPYKSLEATFNVYLVDVVSKESGADGETPGAVRDTALGARFFCNDIEQLLCANADKAKEYADKAPGADQVVILVNTAKFGGAGGSYTTVAGGNKAAREIVMHELGHSIGHLADEYTAPGTYTGDEPSFPNATKDPSGQKWASLLGQPVTGGGVVGAFEGAFYKDKGIYRPSQNSLMRSLGREFDPVGLTAMRAGILAKVS